MDRGSVTRINNSAILDSRLSIHDCFYGTSTASKMFFIISSEQMFSASAS